MWEQEFENKFGHLPFFLGVAAGARGSKENSHLYSEIIDFIKANFIEKQSLKEALEGMKGSVQGLSSAGGPVNTIDEAHVYNNLLDDILKLIDRKDIE